MIEGLTLYSVRGQYYLSNDENEEAPVDIDHMIVASHMDEAVACVRKRYTGMKDTMPVYDDEGNETDENEDVTIVKVEIHECAIRESEICCAE